MAGIQTETIEALYARFRYNELTFSDTIIKSSGIIRRDIFLKAGEIVRPCTIISVSMNGIKLTVKLKDEEFEHITAEESVSVHFSFIGFKPYFIPLSFFIPYQLSDTKDAVRLDDTTLLFSMSCLGKPPAHFIRILGGLFQVHAATTKRAEVRVSVTRVTAEDLRLKSTTLMIRIDGIRQECLIQDLSFSGCQVLLNTQGSFEKKKIVLEMLFRDPDELCEIPGTIMRFAAVRGSREKGTAGIHFDAETVPHEYTTRLHSILD